MLLPQRSKLLSRHRYGFFWATLLLAFASGGCAPTAESHKPEDVAKPAPAGAATQTAKRGNTAVPDSNDPFWRNALKEVYRSTDELAAQKAREERGGTFLKTIARGDATRKEIALTFDDGPHPDFTPKLLELLKREKIPATFFVIGKMAEKSPELIKQMLAEGHTVGNHTFSHVTLTKIPEELVEVEYKANNDLIKQITGQQMAFCRPPGGDYDADVVKAAERQGLTTVLWSDDPGDYASPGGDVIKERTLQHLSNGAVLLLHDGIEQTYEVLPQIIAYARKNGYRFVSLQEMESHLAKKGK